MVQFKAADFLSNFNDSINNNLMKIKIGSQPAHGILKLLSVAVHIDQEIEWASLGNLVFEPELDWLGITHFY